jgi:hypothetical protein
MVTTFPDTDAIVGDNELNKNEPGLFEVGFVNVNDVSENCLFGITKLDKVGMATFTEKVAVIDPEVYTDVAACVAVIVTVPDFKMVRRLPADIVAISVSLLVNVNSPLLVEVGFGNSNGADPYTRGSIMKFDNTGVVI